MPGIKRMSRPRMEKNHTVTAVPTQQLITMAPATILCNCIPPNNNNKRKKRKDGSKSRTAATWWMMRFKEEVVVVVVVWWCCCFVVTLLTQKQQLQSCFFDEGDGVCTSQMESPFVHSNLILIVTWAISVCGKPGKQQMTTQMKWEWELKGIWWMNGCGCNYQSAESLAPIGSHWPIKIGIPQYSVLIGHWQSAECTCFFCAWCLCKKKKKTHPHTLSFSFFFLKSLHMFFFLLFLILWLKALKTFFTLRYQNLET